MNCPSCQAASAHLVKTTSKGIVVSYRCLHCGHSFEPPNPFVLIEPPMLITNDFRPTILSWLHYEKKVSSG